MLPQQPTAAARHPWVVSLGAVDPLWNPRDLPFPPRIAVIWIDPRVLILPSLATCFSINHRDLPCAASQHRLANSLVLALTRSSLTWNAPAEHDEERHDETTMTRTSQCYTLLSTHDVAARPNGLEFGSHGCLH